MLIFDELTEENLFLYAAKHYDNPNFSDVDDFYEDLKRFKYIKRLFSRYVDKKELKERLILNHMITLYNVFEYRACTRMLFHKIDDKHWHLLKTFLIFMERMPDHIEGIREKDTNLVAEAKYDTKYATLVNCAVYHRAVNYSNVPRYVIHFRLVRKSDPNIDIKFREAKKIFKSHIVDI